MIRAETLEKKTYVFEGTDMMVDVKYNLKNVTSISKLNRITGCHYPEYFSPPINVVSLFKCTVAGISWFSVRENANKLTKYLIRQRIWLLNHVCHHPDQYDLIPRTSVPWSVRLTSISTELANKGKNRNICICYVCVLRLNTYVYGQWPRVASRFCSNRRFELELQLFSHSTLHGGLAVIAS